MLNDAWLGLWIGVGGGVVMFALAAIVAMFTSAAAHERLGISLGKSFVVYTLAGACGGVVVGAMRQWSHQKWLRWVVMSVGAFVVLSVISSALGNRPWEWSRPVTVVAVLIAMVYGTVVYGEKI